MERGETYSPNPRTIAVMTNCELIFNRMQYFFSGGGGQASLAGTFYEKLTGRRCIADILRAMPAK